MQRIRRFDVVQTANTLAVLYFILGAIFVVAMWLFMAAGTSLELEGGPQWLAGAMLILMPVIYAVLGWVFVALACLLYNLTARLTGGIAIELEAE